MDLSRMSSMFSRASMLSGRINYSRRSRRGTHMGLRESLQQHPAKFRATGLLGVTESGGPPLCQFLRLSVHCAHN